MKDEIRFMYQIRPSRDKIELICYPPVYIKWFVLEKEQHEKSQVNIFKSVFLGRTDLFEFYLYVRVFILVCVW